MFGKDIIGLENFSPDEIRQVLKTAKEMKKIIRSDVKKTSQSARQGDYKFVS